LKFIAVTVLLFVFINGCHSQVKINTMEIKKFGEELSQIVKSYSDEPAPVLGVSPNTS